MAAIANFLRKFKPEKETQMDKEPLIVMSKEDFEEILQNGKVGTKIMTEQDFKQAKIILSKVDYKKLEYIVMMQNLHDYNLI